MRFSKWHALGNSYLVVEQPDAGPLTPTRVQRLCSVETGIGSDGVIEVGAHDAAGARRHDLESRRLDGRDVRATASGSRRAGSRPGRVRLEVTIRAGGREIEARMLNTARHRHRSGRGRGRRAGARRRRRADDRVGRESARRHPPRRSDAGRSPPTRAPRRDAPAVSRAHERPARARRRPARPDRARVGAGGGGDERLRLVVGGRRVRRRRTRLVRQPRHGAPPGRRPSRPGGGRRGLAHRPGGADRVGETSL